MFTGFQNAGTGANAATTGTAAWANPSRVTACDASFSAATMTAGVDSQLLNSTNFGIVLPADAIIRGIKVSITKKSANAKNVDKIIKLLIGGVASGNNKADAVTVWPTTAAVVTYGGPDDLWGLTPTIAQLTATNFGVQIQSGGDGANDDTSSVDCVTVCVWFDTGGYDRRP